MASRELRVGLVLVCVAGVWLALHQLGDQDSSLYRLVHDPGDGDESTEASVQQHWLPPAPVSPFETVRGRCVDAAGRPIAGVHVTNGEAEVCTAVDGGFLLRRTHEPLHFDHAAWFPLELMPPPAQRSDLEGPRELTAVLWPACRISGRIVSEDGSAVRDAWVTFSGGTGSEQEGAPIASVLTDGEGRYVSPRLESTSIRLHVLHEDHSPRSEDIVLGKPGVHLEQTIELDTGRAVRITTRDPSGRPIPDCRLSLEMRDDDSSREVFLGITGDLGRLYCHLPREESAFLSARHVARRDAVLALRGTGNGESQEEDTGAPRTQIELVLREAPQVRAMAIDVESGLPADVRTAHLERLDVARGWQRVPSSRVLLTAGSRGDLVLGLPDEAGRYRVQVEAHGSLSGRSEEFTFDGDNSPGTLTVDLERRLELRGIVLTEGRVVVGARINLLAAEAELLPRGGDELSDEPETFVVAVDHSDPSGNFAFELTDPGRFRLSVSHPEYLPWHSRVLSVPSAPSDPELLAVYLGRGATIEGTVHDSEGRVAADVVVVLLDASGPLRATRTSEAGGWSFGGLEDGGQFTIAVPTSEAWPRLWILSDSETPDLLDLARHTWSEEVGIPVRVEANGTERVEVSIDEPAPGRVEGSVTVNGVRTRLPLLFRALDGDAQQHAVSAAEDGSFDVRCVPAGSYELIAPRLGGRQQVEVGPAEVTRVQLDLASPTLLLAVVDSETGRYLDVDCRVQVLAEWLDAGRIGRRTRPLTARDGSLRIDGLAASPVHLRLDAPGYVASEERFHLAARGEQRFTARLTRGVTTQIRLLSAPGQVYRGKVEWAVRQGGRVVREQSEPYVDAILELPALAAGRYDLTVKTSQGTLRRRLTIGAQ